MRKEQAFRTEKLRPFLDLIETAVVRESIDAISIDIKSPSEPCFNAPSDDGEWAPMKVGSPWGTRQEWASFRAHFEVPGHWREGAVELELRHRENFLVRPLDDNWPAGPEGQVFVDGERVGAIDREHVTIRHDFRPGATHEVRAIFFAGRCELRHALEAFRLNWIDSATRRLWYDLRVTLDLVAVLPEESPTREKLIRAVEAAAAAIDVRDLSVASSPHYRLRDPQKNLFRDSVSRAQAAFDDARRSIRAAGEVPRVVVLGHAHNRPGVARGR